MDIKKAAQTAIDCQDACNLSGVLASFKVIVHEVIWPEARRLNKGTDWVNSHPICTLFIDKLADLNGRADFGPAYRACELIAETGEMPTLEQVGVD